MIKNNYQLISKRRYRKISPFFCDDMIIFIMIIEVAYVIILQEMYLEKIQMEETI